MSIREPDLPALAPVADATDATGLEVLAHNKPQKLPPLWRNRNFALLWGGQFVSSVGSQVSLIAFPVLMYALTHSAVQTGLIGALRGLPYLVLMLPAGALVDRMNRKRVMIVCDVGRAIALGSIPFALALRHLSIAQLYLVTLIEGTLMVFFTLAETASIPHVVPAEQLTAAVAQSQALDSTAVMVGPALEGLFYSVSSAFAFLADAISYAVSVVSLLFIHQQFQEQREHSKITPATLWREIREGIAWLWRAPVLRFLAILTSGLMISSFGYSLIIIVLAQQEHVSSVELGLIFGAGGVGAIIGSLLLGFLQKRLPFPHMIIGSTWIWALSWLLFAVAFNPLLLAVANMLNYIVVPIYIGAQFSYRLSMIPDQYQGRVNAVFRLIAFGSQPIGLALTGLLIQLIGPISAVLALSVPLFALAIAATMNRHLRAVYR